MMALAISIAVGCEGCIAYHTHDAIKAGATRAELLETIGVGVMTLAPALRRKCRCGQWAGHYLRGARIGSAGTVSIRVRTRTYHSGMTVDSVNGALCLPFTTERVAMDKTPSSDWARCLPNVDGVTYLKVGPHGITIGMMNLDAVFKQLLTLGRRPEETTDEEVLSLARRFNYIPAGPDVTADYAVALRRAYTAFCARQMSKSGST